MKEKKIKNPKREVRVELYMYTEIDNVIRGTFEQAAANLVALEKKLWAGNALLIENPKMWLRTEVLVAGGYDDSPSLEFYAIRLETNEEYAQRIKKEKEHQMKVKALKESHKNISEERERKEWERLRKKFGVKTEIQNL